MSLSIDSKAHEYKPGSIRRIKLKNFLTYADVEFSMGPRLNMVVGPNGTGKSTILCAICLGLGGEPKLLGRADDARTFIMHEQDVAMVEIEVAPLTTGGNPHIFTRVIDRNKGSETGKGQGASTWAINGNKTTHAEVKKIVKETYHISVDNLCTFLPQDRVGSFSGFDAQSLLMETEKSLSASGHLYDQHLQLIETEDKIRKGGNDKEHMEARLKALEEENERLEREKERIEERELALEQKELLEKKMIWLKFDQVRDEAIALKQRKTDMKQQHKEAHRQLAPIEERHASIASQKKRMDDRFRVMDVEAKGSDRAMQKQKTKAENHCDQIDDTLSNLIQVDADQRIAQRDVEKQHGKVQQLEAQLADYPSKDNVEQAMREATVQFRAVKTKVKEARANVSQLKEHLTGLTNEGMKAEQKLKRLNDDKLIRNERIFRQEPNLDKVTKWVEANRKHFRRPVLGPVVCEVTTKTSNASAFLEQHVPNSLLKSFVVECKEDDALLYREVRQKMKLPINIILCPQGKLQPVRSLYSDRKMKILKQDHGVIGLLDDAFSAPDSVRQALRVGANVDRVLVGTEKTQQSIDEHSLLDFLTENENGGKGAGSVIYTSQGQQSFKYTTNISRFPPFNPSTRIDNVGQARMLAPGVAPEQKQEMEREVQQLKEEVAKIRPETEQAEIRSQEAEVKGQEIAARLKETRATGTKLAAMGQRLTTATRKYQEAQNAAASDDSDKKDKLLRTLMARIKSGVSALEEHSKSHGIMMKCTHTSAGVRINQDGLGAMERKARTLLEENKAQFDDIERQLKEVSAQFSQAKATVTMLKRDADEKAPLSDEQGNELPLKNQLEELPVESMDEAEAALEEATAKVNSIDANPDALRQYEERKIEIEEVRTNLEQVNDVKENQLKAMDQAREPWENALKNSVNKVDILFGKYMQELGCAGQVKLSRGDAQSGRGGRKKDDEAAIGNFKNWGIEILVKFREKSKLQVLSAQVQSGGERSVSTIMYLMALQEMMVSPFRCVDEINQGLDERNERLVFKRIVENSTRPPTQGSDPSSHSGQYFLITPKLLPNLYDMESDHMTVLFIFNGPHNFKNPLDWNVKKFIEMKKRLREEEEEQLDEDVGDENSPDGMNSAIQKRPTSKKKRRKSTEQLG